MGNKEDGNLLNVIESLAALFILNCIHEDSKNKLFKYGYKKINLKMFNYVTDEDFYFDYDSYPLTTSQLFEFEKNYSPLKISIPKQKPWAWENLICKLKNQAPRKKTLVLKLILEKMQIPIFKCIKFLI